jgi:signal transduction histidine kinase
MLTGYLSITCIMVSLIYAWLDLTNGVFYSLPSYIILLLAPIISLWLIRQRKNKAAKITLMVGSNLVVFLAALNDPFETGAFLFFIPGGVGSFAMLGFEDFKTGVGLAVFATFLFLLAYFGPWHPFDTPRPSDEYIRISFVFNYFISLTISILIVYFLINLNRHSEEDLIQKENLTNAKNVELKNVNAALDRFVYSVSHDLRSPLSSILGLTNIARITQDRAELDNILTMIQNRVNAQDHYIQEIIDYSRNARTEIVEEPIKLKPLVEEVLTTLKFNVNAEKIAFVNLVPDDIVLMSDRIRLNMILNNLIGNAIKYHAAWKENPFIEIGFDNNRQVLHVKDNGIGIMPEHQSKIFNMFYRASDRSTGSGLGLFITKEAVTKLNGTIQVTSGYGEGSTFFVYFKQPDETAHQTDDQLPRS